METMVSAKTGRSLVGLLRNMAFAGVSAASAGLLLVLLIFASRTLSDGDYGKLSIALAMGGIFETMMDFGLQQVTIRHVARNRTEALRVFQNSLGLKLLWATGALAVLMVTATLYRSDWDVRLACYLVGGSLVLRSYTLTVRGVLQGLERFGWDSVVVLLDRVFLLAAGVWTLAAGYGLEGLGIAFVGSRAFTLLAAGLVARHQIGPPILQYDRQLWLELQRAAVPLGLFLVVINVYSYVDTLMLGRLRTDVETGLYTNAYRVYEGLTYGAAALASVLTPRLSRYFVTSRRKHTLLAVGGIGASLAMAVAIGGVAYWVAEPLMVGLFGPAFRAAAEPFRILAAGLALVYAVWVLHATAISMNHGSLLLTAGVIGLAAKVVLNAVLIPPLGTRGAAIAVIVCEGISVAVLLVGLSRTAGRPSVPRAEPA
jgi:O-antigen/teichoic acid export membrane protein